MISGAPADTLSAGLRELIHGEIEPVKISKLLAFLELLDHWNNAYNLTAVRDPQQMVTRHLLDSLSVMPWIESGPLLDAGTGAGLPGIPLAIMRPELQISLLDSNGKKVRFLRQVARQLKLSNIRPLQARLESWRCDDPPRLIISRAFSDLGTFASAARHLAGEETKLLAMKGRYPQSELDVLPDWLQLDSVKKLGVPGLQEERHLVIMSFIP